MKVTLANERKFRTRCHFQVSLRLEIFDALQTLLNPESRIHPGWKKVALGRLPRRWKELCARIGSSSEIWPVIAAVLPKEQAAFTFDQMVSCIRSRPASELQREILLGILHNPDSVEVALRKNSSLKAALGSVPKEKREWLQYVGLYPYQAGHPTAVALEFLISDPRGFQETVIEMIKAFWESGFKQTWALLQPQLKKSLEEKERLFQVCSLSEFSQQALLRIQVDEKRASIQAIRGGYELPLKDVTACTFMPSAFNDRRYWSALKDETEGTVHIYFPYFDPSIAIDLKPAGASGAQAEAELDPALIFKALGDSTRYAIITLVSRHAMNSVDLASRLSVSKPTISHHVQLLREAGLIDERYQAGSVLISARQDTFERISEITVDRLFHSKGRTDLKTTRRATGSQYKRRDGSK